MNNAADMTVMIGLEIHIELKTDSKLFCTCPSCFGAPANSLSCPVCAGHPGTLPRLNRAAVLQGLRLGLALGGKADDTLIFDRKSYFYPDLPKAYQITQRRRPIIRGGELAVSTAEGFKTVRIREAHIEEDAGKLQHDRGSGVSLVDLNRSGVPLLEVVTEPDLACGEEAAQFARRLRDLAVWLGVSDGKMQEGSLRADVNLSLCRDGVPGERTEIKNLGSFRDIVRAADAEAERQRAIYAAGGRVERCTLRWDGQMQTVTVMREKEGEGGYRYSPEPDIPPVALAGCIVDDILCGFGELPHDKELRYISMGVAPEKAELACRDRAQAELCDAVIALGAPAVQTINWVLGEVAAVMRRRGLEGAAPVPPRTLARLIELTEKGAITRATAKELLDELFDGGDADELIAQRGLVRVDDGAAVHAAVDAVICEGGKAVDDYLAGKDKAFAAIMGAVMRRLKGRADPQLVTRMLREALDK